MRSSYPAAKRRPSKDTLTRRQKKKGARVGRPFQILLRLAQLPVAFVTSTVTPGPMEEDSEIFFM